MLINEHIVTLDNTIKSVGERVTGYVDTFVLDSPNENREIRPNFARFIGTTTITAAVYGTMFALDKFTGQGMNPIDYAMGLTFMSNY